MECPHLICQEIFQKVKYCCWIVTQRTCPCCWWRPTSGRQWAGWARTWPASASWGPEDSLVLEDRSLLSPAYSPAPDQCPELTRKYDDAMVVLQNLQDGMLEDMCGQKECDKVIVTSMGLSAVKQPTRWGQR